MVRTRPMRRRLSHGFLAAAAAIVITSGLAAEAQGQTANLWFDDVGSARLTATPAGFVDGRGREVLLRGFNVSGEVKLAENAMLPFANVADARRSATAMRRLTGANSVRFLLSWAAAEPSPGQIDQTYLQKVTEQMRVFLDQGFYVLPDYHQDLYSRYLFNAGSWYTGDGAPQWVVAAGGYPQESCGICVQWGQNITSNEAVKAAMYDFWHNRRLTTSAGVVGVQDAFLNQAKATMTYLKGNLTADQFTRVVGFDPYNEPYAGTYDSGENSETWENRVLWPFFQRFRQAMDDAGWQDKPAFVEPNLFWDSNIGFAKQTGGFTGIGQLGSRYVFNSHFYDHAALSGVLMWGKASDGQETESVNAIRQRGTALGTAAVVSEFGHTLSGYTSDKMPTVVKAIYQALDSGVNGANWWADAENSRRPLSGMQWQWDIYSGRHRELMNGNPDKVLTETDAWNGEDYSAMALAADGTPQLRQDARLVDRVYPRAVGGRTLAFTYEDRSRDGTTTLTWNQIPSGYTNIRQLVGSGQYAVLAWRSDAANAPTELHLPAAFPATSTTVVSDLGTVSGLPQYTAQRQVADRAIAIAAEPGGEGAQRLVLSDPSGAGVLHYALITNGASAPSAQLLSAARQELAAWAAATPFPS